MNRLWFGGVRGGGVSVDVVNEAELGAGVAEEVDEKSVVASSTDESSRDESRAYPIGRISACRLKSSTGSRRAYTAR